MPGGKYTLRRNKDRQNMSKPFLLHSGKGRRISVFRRLFTSKVHVFEFSIVSEKVKWL